MPITKLAPVLRDAPSSASERHLLTQALERAVRLAASATHAPIAHICVCRSETVVAVASVGASVDAVVGTSVHALPPHAALWHADAPVCEPSLEPDRQFALPSDAAQHAAEPETDAPQTDAPQTDAPQTDAPQTDAPQTDAPQTDNPQTDNPKTDDPQHIPVASYAGLPVALPAADDAPSATVATLCVMDRRPRAFQDAIPVLHDLCALLSCALAPYRALLVDSADGDASSGAFPAPDRERDARPKRTVDSHYAADKAQTALLQEQRDLLAQTQRLAGAWMYDVETRRVTWSDAVYRINDLPPGSPIDLNTALRFYDSDSRAVLRNAIREAIDEHKPYDLTLSLVTARGATRWVRAVGEPIVEDGRVVKLTGAIQDITDRERALKRLQVQSKILQRIVEGASLSQVLLDLILSIEAQESDVYGSVVFYDGDTHRLHHGVAPNLPAPYIQALDGTQVDPDGPPCAVALHESQIVASEDIATDPRWEDLRAVALACGLRSCWSVPIHGSQGTVLGSFALYTSEPHAPTDAQCALMEQARWLAGIAIEHHRSETALHASYDDLEEQREQLALALAGGDLGVWDWNMQTDAVAFSDRWCEMLGYAPDELDDRLDTFDRLIHPDDRERVYASVDAHIQGEQPRLNLEVRMRAKDGTWRWVLDRGRILERAPDGTPLRMVGTHMDITERKEAQRSLTQRGARVKALYSALGRLTAVEEARDVAEHVHQLITDTFGYSGCVIRRLEGDTLRAFVVSDDLGAAMGTPRPPYALHGDSLAARAFRENQTLCIDDIQTSGTAATARIHKPGAIRSVAYLPLSPHGVISIGSTDAGGIPLADIHLLEILAHATTAVLERIERETALREARDEAETMNRLKTAFLRNMSHEFRTPLTGMVGFAEVLLATDLSDTAARFARTIHTSSRRLMTTLNAILDLSQLEAGTMPLRPQRLDLVREVRDIVHPFEKDARQKRIAFSTDLPCQRAPVLLDRTALRCILSNLVSNAVKFTPADGCVDVALRQEAAAITLTVRDTGVGIDPAFRPKIFDAFQQESTGDQRAFVGAGVGLAVTKRWIDRVGGTIDVDSTKGAGTTVCVRLPVLPPDEAEAAEAE